MLYHFDIILSYSCSFELELELDADTKCCVTSTTKWDKVEEIIGEHYRLVMIM